MKELDIAVLIASRHMTSLTTAFNGSNHLHANGRGGALSTDVMHALNLLDEEDEVDLWGHVRVQSRPAGAGGEGGEVARTRGGPRQVG